MAGKSAAVPRHFAGPAAFRAWLEKHHDTVGELWVGFYRKGTGKVGLTYPEAVDEALCYGWIDGIKKRVDHERYTNRFTPRKPISKWSAVNLRRYGELEKEGRVAPAGRAAYRRFDPDKHAPYSFESRITKLSPELERMFRVEAEAWAFFREQPPGYRKTAIFWVMSAKRAETRERRVGQLIEVSKAGGRLPQISGRPRRKGR